MPPYRETGRPISNFYIFYYEGYTEVLCTTHINTLISSSYPYGYISHVSHQSHILRISTYPYIP